MQVNAILKDNDEYMCDTCEEDAHVALKFSNSLGETPHHLCATHAREMARRLIAALSHGTYAGQRHEQGSEKVPRPLNEDDIATRTEEHVSDRIAERSNPNG